MKTIYMTRDVWEDRALDRAVGETGGCGVQEIRFCAAAQNKVIDLAAWKAENLVELDEGTDTEWGLEPYEAAPVGRPRRDHSSVLVKGELAATLSVVGVMLAMMIRVLAF